MGRPTSSYSSLDFYHDVCGAHLVMGRRGLVPSQQLQRQKKKATLLWVVLDGVPVFGLPDFVLLPLGRVFRSLETLLTPWKEVMYPTW